MCARHRLEAAGKTHTTRIHRNWRNSSAVVTGLSLSCITARRTKTRFKKAGTLRYNHIEFIRDRSLGQAPKPATAILHHWETLMPLFTVTMKAGRAPDEKNAISRAIHEASVKAGYPDTDMFQRFFS